ncbi:hypothetical protein TIFTF001_050825 [Ficus carica]|uniref:Uncharacterized protein n=1 Tax=Ficus carica TaxID=3494 RepID=A0AA88CJJ0_FICCA|nr:hypothetical protein TIFTF001_050825 [Ficus carica]
MGVAGLTSAMRYGPGRPAQAWEALSGRSDQNTVSSEYTTCSRAGKGRGRLMDVVGRTPTTRPSARQWSSEVVGSDSENSGLSESLDITGSEASSSRTRSSSVGEVMGPEGRTPDHLSGISDIPSPGDQVSPANRELSGAARLEKALRVGPGTAPDRRFVEELGGSFQAPTAPVVDLTVEGGEAAERSAGQASTSGREGDSVSDSTDPSGEDTEARDRPASRGIRINDVKRYLVALRREFNIPENVDLLVPGVDDLPSRPPSGYIALSVEYFRAGLRLPFHPFLRQALTRLNVAPAQLNANAYRVLISC